MATFLDSIRCDSDLFPHTHGDLVVLNGSMPVKEALLILFQNEISSAPVVHASESNQSNCHSWFSLLDCVVAAAQLAKDGAPPEDFFKMHVGQIAPASSKFIAVPNTMRS